MTRGIRLAGFLTLALLATPTVFLSERQTQATPQPFEPGGVVCVENLESAAECDGDTSPGATSDLSSRFCVGWNADCSVKDTPVTDSNFGGIVFFTPADWYLPKGDTIPTGAIAGRNESEAMLGLLNGACNSRIEVAFTMMNASINTSDTIVPRAEGETDVMQPLAMDGSGNGIPDGADKYPSFLADLLSVGSTPVQPRARLFGISHVQGNWLTLNVVFFEPGTTIEVQQTVITFDPALGYPGITILQDPTAEAAPSVFTDFCAPLLSQNITLGRTVDNPCTPARVVGANCPVSSDVEPDIPELGYPSLPCDTRSKFDDDGDGKVNDGCPQSGPTPESGAQCDNDTSDDAEDSDINDGCPPQGVSSEGARMPGSCSGGDEGGCIHRSNPATAASYNFTFLALSQRDADGDGIENSLDVCFDRPNLKWNPREIDTVYDPDGDGLPTACDPKPNQASAASPNDRCKAGYTGADEDRDCIANRADNCPLKASLQDPTKPPDEKTNKPFAEDGDSDGIGDACDPDPNAPNGDSTGYCLNFVVNIGGPGGRVVGVRKAGRGAPHCAAQGPVIQLLRGGGILTRLLGARNYDVATQGTGLTGGGIAGAESSTTLDVSVVDPTPETPSDLVVDVNLETGDVQFAGVVAYIPKSWGIAGGDALPIGALVGHLESQTNLGLMGAACNTELRLEFDMLNASIDIEDTVSFDDTDRTDTDGTGDYAKDVNPENGLYDSIDRYPDFINRVFDRDNLKPIRRSAGITIVGGIPVLLQSLVFEPGTHINENLDDDPALGYPMVTLLQNAGDPDANPQPGVITDFCTPLTSNNISFGVSQDNDKTVVVDEGGYQVNTNPQDGVYTFATLGAGQRDADGDGYENSLDTCALDTNVGNPRVTADGDLDQDGLDAACDPNDDPATGGANSDQDGDGYLNGQDNCPLAANGADATNQSDEDKDQIGDVCDIAPDTADGELTYRQSTKDITIGAGHGNGDDRDGRSGGGGDDDGGGNAAIFIILGVIAAFVVVGAGGFFLMSRGRSA